MSDPKICNKCCKYTDCFYSNEAVCYNCEEPKIKRRQKDQSIDKQREKRIIMASRASKLFFIVLMFLQGCTPASKKALEETNLNHKDLAIEVRKIAESQKLHADIINKYVVMPDEVKSALNQDAENRINESKAIEEKAIETSKKEVGIFSKGQFMYFVTQFYDVAKPVLKDVAKAVVDVASSQGGIVGGIVSALTLAYGVYQHVSKNTVVAKVVAEKAEAKEIEHEADKLIPVERHAEWEEAENKAKVKVLSKKKGLS